MYNPLTNHCRPLSHEYKVYFKFSKRHNPPVFYEHNSMFPCGLTFGFVPMIYMTYTGSVDNRRYYMTMRESQYKHHTTAVVITNCLYICNQQVIVSAAYHTIPYCSLQKYNGLIVCLIITHVCFDYMHTSVVFEHDPILIEYNFILILYCCFNLYFMVGNY